MSSLSAIAPGPSSSSSPLAMGIPASMTTTTAIPAVPTAATAVHTSASKESRKSVRYELYGDESQLPAIDALMRHDLSEPYSFYTYRYFLHTECNVSWLAFDGDSDTIIGAIVCNVNDERPHKPYRGYIAMLAVDPQHRKRGIGSSLVVHAVGSMRDYGCTQAYLETEHTNEAALRLYLNLGFVKDKLLARYYLNGNDAFRLKLLLAPLPSVGAARSELSSLLRASAAAALSVEEIGHDEDRQSHLCSPTQSESGHRQRAHQKTTGVAESTSEAADVDAGASDSSATNTKKKLRRKKNRKRRR